MQFDIIQQLERLPSNPILVVGDVMLDRFMYGQVDRISPEAPIPVMRYVREISMLGGAGNVVRNLVSLKQHCDLISVIGADSAGFEVAKQLSLDEVITPHLLTDKDRPTTIKTRFVAGIQQVLRCDVERAENLSAAMEDQVITRLRLAVPQVSAVILSDYAKGVLTQKVIAEAIALGKQHNKPVIIDPKGRDYTRYTGADIVTPNRKELTEASGHEIRTVEDAVKASEQLIAKYKFKAVLAKLGGDGVCLVAAGKPPIHIKATAREVYDVSGAGDTVIAGFATALAAGMSMEHAAHTANEAGSIVVSKVGTATVSIEELINNFRQVEDRDINEKVLTQNKAIELVERWRRQGLNVGFTNGCFDLVHPGHISLLQQSRKACDRLVVGLNSDASVKRLKGAERPVQNEKARATVLATLNPVDLVVIFNEDTPLELIKALRPNVLVKGADYTEETVVGAADVKSWGGSIVLANLVEGQSTTNTIKKLKSGA
ncbi:MAG: D-glycero-beta-D-manno-heptose-7-phosphate kinase [Alphaproteobacteria bacterium]|nr:D-glycero-beta-D-manno-heptose-7-phosphate kinase [Alphaproteobacteria bacterium]